MHFIEVSLGLAQVTFFSPDTVGYLLIILISAFALTSAMMSAAEVAFFSLNQSNINTLKKKNTYINLKIVKLIKEPKQLLGTVLITKHLANAAIIVLTFFFVSRISDFSQIPMVGYISNILIITFLILIPGETIPKIYSAHHPIRISSILALPISFLSFINRPFVLLLIKNSTIVDKHLKKKKVLSINDLSNALELTSDTSNEEKNILRGIVEFGSTEVNDILTSRLEIVALEIKCPLKKVLQLILESGYSRIPIYNSNIDNIKGILYIKDLLPHTHKPDFKWQSLVRPPFFIPEKKKINDLLQEFQTNKNHMAVVVDEYGGTKGIVTLEDILEEIVGEIRDEFDEDDKNYIKIDDSNYIFSGTTLIHDFYKITGVSNEIFEDSRGESDTLAGFILEIKGAIPQLNETIYFKNFQFKIEEADSRRIKKIRFIIPS